MSIIKKYHIIGFGNRVKYDLLPVIFNQVGVNNVNVYSKSERKENIGGVIVNSMAISEFFQRYKNNCNEIIVISINHDALPLFLSDLAKIDTGNAVILIDTPITSILDISIIKAKCIYILEDVPPSPVGAFLRYMKNHSAKLIIFYKSFYKYHGYSMFRYLCSNKNYSSKIFRIFKTKIISLYKVDNNFCIVVGERDYSRARIIGIGNNCLMSDRLIQIHNRGSKVIVSYKNEVIDEYDQCGGLACGNIFNDFDKCKRLGLFRLINNINLGLNKVDYLTSPMQALDDYIQTKFM